ncbi:ninein-like [Corticium candelabrum]|uniref:ninein-like n=1 Tax=Corticium candelabrum TaxID=121492 RepID=UPI002E25CE0A|nr:ninein-like [Corticium candelabrum]
MSAIEDGLEKAHLAHLNRMIQTHEDELQKHVFAVLAEVLSADELEETVCILTCLMTEAEVQWSFILSVQLEALYWWLESRQTSAESFTAFEEMKNEDVQKRLQQFSKDVNVLIGDKQLEEKDKSSLQLMHEEAVLKVVTDYKQKLDKEVIVIHENMKKIRESNIKKLEAEQQEKMEEKVDTWCQQVGDGLLTLEYFIEMYRTEVGEQCSEWLQLHKQADNEESQELEKLKKSKFDEYLETVNKEEVQIYNKLAQKAQLSKSETYQMLEQKKGNTQFIIAASRKKFEAKEAELKGRKTDKLWKCEKLNLEGERDQFVKFELEAVTRMLEKQIGLSQRMHKRVTAEHKRLAICLANQLLLSKVRQQKRLEHRLAQQNVRLVLLQQKHDEEKRQTKQQSPELIEMILQRQKEEYIDAKKELDRLAFAARNELTSRLAQQTEEAANFQDMKLGILMGKVQAERLRKQEVEAHQEVTVQNLKKRLLSSVTLPQEETHVIMEQHQRDMDKLHRSRKISRSHQIMAMTEKLNAKKLKKERELESSMSTASDESKTGQLKKTKSATVMLAHVIKNQQRKVALETMTEDFELEQARITKELNDESEQQLKHDLQEAEKNLIGQLAVKSKLSEKELEDLVRQSAPGTTTTIVYTSGLSSDIKKISKRLSISS